MKTFGALLFIASFFISFFFARKKYRSATIENPQDKFRNIISAILWYAISWVIILIVTVALVPSSDKPAQENTATQNEPIKEREFVREIGEPKKYYVIKRENKTEKDTNRVVSFWILAPEAVSYADRAATVKKAAEVLQQRTKLPVVSVFLQFSKESVGKGYNLALARYFADGCQYSGTECDNVIWSVESSKEVVTQEQIRIFNEWYKNRGIFLSKEGDLNEEKLTAYLAKKLKIDPSDISLPYITTEKVNPYISEDDEKTSIDKMKSLQLITKSKQEEIQKRKKEIESQFSAWDGSHRYLERRIKDSMNDPDSYKHYKTVYIDHGDHITVFTEFGGKNAFGGMVRNTASADYSIDGEFIKMHQ